MWFGLDRSQPEKKPFLQKKHWPQEIVNGTTTRSPTLSLLFSAPTSTTSPMVSWPSTSPFSIDGMTPSNRCRSEPQIAQAVTLMMASRPSSILGSGTVSQRMSFLPCQVSAFIDVSFDLSETQTPKGSSVPSLRIEEGTRRDSWRLGTSTRTTRRELMSAIRPFAIVTGASTGIGFELAKRCAKEGYDLLIAADEPAIEKDRNIASVGLARVEAKRTSRRPKGLISFTRRQRAAPWMRFSRTRDEGRPRLP